MSYPLRQSAPRQRGASLLEFAIVVILVSILIVLAIDRISLVRGRYEAAAITSVIGALRSALGIQLAARVLDPARGSVAALDGCNPFDFVVMRNGAAYGGVVDKPEPQTLLPGRWYYDSASGDIIYRVRNDAWFKSSLPGPARVRFRVELEYRDRDGDHRYTPHVDQLEGVDLKPLDDYSWKE